MKRTPKFEPLAIVGMSCLFPKAQSLQDYWANIKEKVDCISEVPETSWKTEDYYNPDKKCPDHVYTKNGGFLNPVDFNPAEWGIAPTDLDSIDTSQLLSLVVAKGALADAGYANKDFDRDNTSVILGLTGTLELVVPLGARLGHPYWKKAMMHAGIDEKIANEVMESIGKCYVGWQENSFPGLLGNCAAGRIANRLDLHGTNCVVDAACGSSLAALNMAAMELWTGKADMAITGGIDTFNDIFMFMCFCKTPALSPTGHARPFSADNDGTILGEGIGMVVIKRLSDAERDGDRIYACINAVGTSSDGKGKAVYAPSVPGQVKALKRAYEESGIDPKDIGMIEAHGTGTGAGDRVEVEALKEVYGVSETNRPWCALGSVKSQIGHTKAAAGSANIIKAAMALYNKVIPPTIKVSQPADSLKDENLPFYLPNQIRPWVSDEGKTRHAALSSMGFGGSNYHVILTEYKSEKTEYDWEKNVELITLSGSNASEIKTKLESLKSAKEIRRFAAEARKAFKNTDNARLGFVIDASTDIDKIVTDISSKLDTCDNKDFTLPNGAAFSTLSETGKIGILFPGQGSQYPDMALNLMCTSPKAFNALVEADKEIGKLDDAGNHLVDFIYPRPTYNEEKDSQNPEKLKATDIAQPSLGAVSIGMYNTLKDFGLEAAGFAGHSYGELVSLCAAGLFDSKALALISRKRGQLMGQGTGDRGGMIAVIGAREDVEKIMEEEKLDLVVANHNSNKQVVLSGKTSEIERSKDIFKAKKLRATVLNVAGAFHSKFVSDAAVPFFEYLKEFNFGELKYPVYANTTAEKYPTDKEEARKLLGNQLANQVRFVEIIKKMYADGIRTFIEVGPGAVLSGLIKNILDTNDYKVVTLDSSKGKNSSVVDLGKALAQLAAIGYKIDIEKWQNGAEWLEKNPISNKPKMNIPLVGANYKSKALLEHRAEIEKPPVRKLIDEKDVKVVTKVVYSESENGLPRSLSTARNDCQTESTKTITTTTTQNAQTGISSLNQVPLPQYSNTTIETLAALQIMQQETAELHKRFLEGQELAQRALLAAITGQAIPQGAQVPPMAMPHEIPVTPIPPMGRPVNPSMPPVAGPTFYQCNVPPVQPKEQVQQNNAGLPDCHGSCQSLAMTDNLRSRNDDNNSSVNTITPTKPSTPITPSHTETTNTITATTTTKTTTVDADKLRDTLIDVVAEKTGYPAEMLNLDMDMEAELGIDSIKRVEIMSAIQERLPDAPVVQPDQLGKLRTLNQILEVITPQNNAGLPRLSARNDGQPETTKTITTTTTTTTASIDNDKLRQTLIDVVSEKTGYPAEMLNLDMDMEAELGIDSIKRVEIMSAIQERLPEAPVVQPDQLGKLRTLNQILEVITPQNNTGLPRLSARNDGNTETTNTITTITTTKTASIDSDKLRQTLIDVVSEKTGYPADMLNLDMDMEAELGIDSIKRVEIMSAIQEKLPDAPVVQPDQLGKLRTLNQILEVITPQNNTRLPHLSARNDGNTETTNTITTITTTKTASIDSDKLRQTLIDVVSEKTGYPADMLNLDMDMEAELGIDSIKRVEIMSAIQEKLPDAPVVQPDQLGKLRTLNQILEVITPQNNTRLPHLSARNDGNTETTNTITTITTTKTASIDSDKLRQTLIDVVSEKTGYPSDMLNLDMDMEAELGIDSIKRVEIMSAIQERLPDAPVVQPDQLGKLRTLNQILEVISPQNNAGLPRLSARNDGQTETTKTITTTTTTTTASISSEKLRSTLIEVVSEKTGYPADMLNLDMDMEAELGIDSIKRVEIMSAIQERLPEAPVVQPDQLGKLRTLNQILEVITPKNDTGLPRSLSTARNDEQIEEEDNAEDFELKRTIIKAVEIGKPDGIKLLKNGDKVVISNDDAELAESLAKKLSEKGFNAETQSLAEIMDGKFPKDAKGLVVIAPKPEKAALNLWEDSSVEWLKDAFMAIKEAGSALKANKGVLATVSRLDGSFGLASMTKNVDPVQGGLAGISKTTRYEWSEVASKAIDLDYRLKENDTAAELLAEEITLSGPMETGLSKTSRKMIEEIEEARSEKADAPATFQKGDTIIVTGGARGVTAETAIAFAKQYGTNMVLIGRSALPESEPAWLASLKNEAEIKRAIMDNSGKKMTLKELGAAYKTAMANREVLTNIARLQKLGVKVKYYSASVLDEDQVAKIVAETRSEFGNISGIIHGAGVKRDKNIEDKTREQLDDVINTKVKGLKNLLKATNEDNLKAIVLFSSFSGRQGRTGQVDYAMANEVLNKVAQKVKVLRNDCHVMAFNWGPWDGGMVDSSLRKVFINEGIGLIPLKKGARCPIVELTNNNEGAVEIGIIGLIDGKEALSSSKKA